MNNTSENLDGLVTQPGHLHLLSAKAVVQLLKDGAVTSIELIDIVEERLKATDELLHTTPITCFERARELACSLVHPSSPNPGYLYGLPVLIKDCDAVSGVLWTEGSPLHKDRIPNFSDPIVLQLEKMGAIVVGKTNTPEFCAGSHTFNPLFETTKSPYDTRTSAGGSSGGSAAALGGAQIWLATGSDLGGSLRIPAAFCGVVGFRCTPGRIPRESQSSEQSPERKLPYYLHSVSGPLARNVQDLALFLDSLTTQSALQGEATVGWEGFPIPPSLPPPPPNEPTIGHWEAAATRGTCNPSKLRIGFSTLGLSYSDEVLKTCRDAANFLAMIMTGDAKKQSSYEKSLSSFNDMSKKAETKSNTAVELKQAFDFATAERCFFIFRAASFHKSFNLEYSADDIASMKPEIRWNIDSHLLADNPNEHLLEAIQDSKKLFHHVNNKLFTETIDILVTPATLDGSFDHQLRYPSKGYGGMGIGAELNNYLEWMLPSCLISITSCPALVLPTGKFPDGRPIGVQLVGKWGEDAMILEAASALEEYLGLGYVHGIDRPITGNKPLCGSGPMTLGDAELHHKKALSIFQDQYVRRNK